MAETSGIPCPKCGEPLIYSEGEEPMTTKCECSNSECDFGFERSAWSG